MRLASGTFAACCVAIEVLGVAVFLRGFFPVPVRSASGAERRAEPPAPEPAAGAASNWTALPPPLFGKVVVLLVDALRGDFVFGPKGARHMPYASFLVERGASHSFVAEAKPPTVTMPRIKALVTGSLPGFVDIIRNLNSPELLEDSVVGQAAAAGRRVVFFGDETWVKLFPRHFVEYDGTTSFFVSDYTEVDDNVTRHLDRVLARGAWDLLILHYLGLDHVGHVFGPGSPLIGRKLSEMDGVLRKIHTALLAREREARAPALLVLCGDHGMSEAGGHGASSPEEVSTPLLLVSSAFERKPGDVRRPERVQQTDLAATLAVGLGLPIPAGSIGRLLPPVMEGRPLREQLRLLHLNAAQLSRLLREAVPAYEREPGFEQFKVAERLHGRWVQLFLEEAGSQALPGLGAKVRRQYLDALASLSLALGRQVVQYDVYSMAVGAAVVLEVLALLLLSSWRALSSSAALEVPLASPAFSLLFYLAFLVLLAVHVAVCTSVESSCYFCSLPWPTAGGALLLVSALLCGVASALAQALVPGRPAGKRCPAPPGGRWSELDLLMLLGTAGHAASLGASSFVEEEHQTWYFLTSTLCLALGLQVCRSCFPAGAGPLLQDTRTARRPGALGWAPGSPPDPQDSGGGWESCKVLASPWVVLTCCRLLRPLNQTGVQGAHRPDLGHWLASSEHRAALSALAAVCLALVFALLHRRCSWAARAALGLGLLGVYCYRAATGSVLLPWTRAGTAVSKGTAAARLVYLAVLAVLASGARRALKSRGAAAADATARAQGLWEVHSGLALLAALLLRPHNLPVLAGSLLAQAVLAALVWRRLQPSAAAVTVMHHWFGQAFFYFQGNSNSIATVDVSVGVVGLDGYAEVPAVLLTAFATYAGPVLWASHLLGFLAADASSRRPALSHAGFCYALLCSLPAAAYLGLVTALRHHLFIWSVFSPKLLYEAARLLLAAAVCALLAAAAR